jgi:hypothetical protein
MNESLLLVHYLQECETELDFPAVRPTLEGSRQRLHPGEVHRSLGVNNVCSASECERNESWPYHVLRTEKSSFGEGLC